jgi:hypothetical protein
MQFKSQHMESLVLYYIVNMHRCSYKLLTNASGSIIKESLPAINDKVGLLVCSSSCAHIIGFSNSDRSLGIDASSAAYVVLFVAAFIVV